MSLVREDGREFLSLVSQLSPLVGKSPATRGLALEALVRWSARGTETITVRTQRRIWSQVNHFLDWSVSRDHLAANPLKALQLDQKVRPASYAVSTDDKVVRLLRKCDPALHRVLLVCLLSGMRSEEAVRLHREDVVAKGNLESFLLVQPRFPWQRRHPRRQGLVALEARDTLVEVAFLPAPNRGFRCVRAPHNLKGAMTVRRRQHDPGPPDKLARCVSFAGQCLKLGTVVGAQIQAKVITSHHPTLAHKFDGGNPMSGGEH